MIFLFWRAFSTQIGRAVNPIPANISDYYYDYDDDYSALVARRDVGALSGADTFPDLREATRQHFPRTSWRLMKEVQPGTLINFFQRELSHISRLPSVPTTKTNNSSYKSYAIYRAAIWVERYFYPPMLFIGLFGNILTYIVLSRPIISSLGSSAVYLKMLCVHDTLNLAIGVTRKWAQNVLAIDIRETSTFACKVHRFLHYTCLDASHWILAAVTIDRVIAVVVPYQAKRFCRRKVAFGVIAFIWLFFGTLNSFVLFGVDIEAVPISSEQPTTTTATSQKSADLTIRSNVTSTSVTTTKLMATSGAPVRYACKFINYYAEYFAIHIHRWLIAAFYILGPFGIVLTGNIIITKKLYERKSFLDRMRRGVSRLRRSSGFENQITLRTTTTMMFISSVAFLILGSPAFILLVCGPYFEPIMNKSNGGKALLFFLRSIESFMTYLNHCSHFFFYALLGRSFRKEFYQLNIDICAFFFKKLIPERFWPNCIREDDPGSPVLPTIAYKLPQGVTWNETEAEDIKVFTPAHEDDSDVSSQLEQAIDQLQNSKSPGDLMIDSGIAHSMSNGSGGMLLVDAVLSSSILRHSKTHRRASLDVSSEAKQALNFFQNTRVRHSGDTLQEVSEESVPTTMFKPGGLQRQIRFQMPDSSEDSS